MESTTLLYGMIGGLSFILLIFLVILIRLQLKYKRFIHMTDQVNIEEILIENQNQIKQLFLSVEEHAQELNLLNVALRKTYSKMGIHKYNAFEGLGGQMSAIIILLNDHLDGLLLHSVHSGESHHLYTKVIEKGEAKQTLSKEESNILKETLKK